ncbi:hypothetical protein ABZY81_39340 [Streptomyces sp. NPDC006514]|uniref:hypothetical protein n=1 Tax=Streptomyces sp. NPDC006514 TaxID=3154308 RepID=UPI0033A5703F
MVLVRPTALTRTDIQLLGGETDHRLLDHGQVDEAQGHAQDGTGARIRHALTLLEPLLADDPEPAHATEMFMVDLDGGRGGPLLDDIA